MSRQRAIDITNQTPSGERFPSRLRQWDYRLMQAVDEQGQPLYHYIIPPMVEVPAGQFLMGSDQQDAQARRNEFPLHLVDLDMYEIALHPLTIFEYLLYLEAAQLRDTTSHGRMCRLHRHATPGYRKPEPHLYLDYPVEGMTWHESMAYANWLAQATGEPWRLPTEAEWEKAARGLDGRRYPWGNEWDKDRANTWDGGSQETTPLGLYPGGRSPYGVYDMAGNVFEWTSSVFKRYPYTEAKKDEPQPKKLVVRGGAAAILPMHARVTSRGKAWSAQPIINQGMRLVRGKNNTFLGVQQ